MKAIELRSKSEDELKKLLLDSKKELMNLRFQQTNGSLTNSSRFSVVKKDIARIMTILSQKKISKEV